MNGKLRVMTYNISWELLEGVDSGRLDMSHCASATNNTNNDCTINIAKIICQIGICKINLDKSETYLYDFINLQEIVNKNNQWIYLKNQINQLDPTFLQNYNVEFTEDLPAGIITLYNKKYNLIYKLEGKLSSHDNRPYQILVFKENIININVHFPHFTFYQEEAVKIITCQLNKLKFLVPDVDFSKCKIILSGDFNNNDPTQLMNFPLILNKFGKTFYREPNQLNTCCSPHNNSAYNKSYDHIFYSECQASQYQTLDESEYFIKSNKKIMSDHLPIFAIFPIFPILDRDDSRKYKINYGL